MTNEQLCICAQGGDSAARTLLIEKNLAYIRQTARSVWNQNKAIQFLGIEVEDLEQEGAIGLLQCVDRFDEKKNIKFLTYAATAIRNAMLDMLRRQENFCTTESVEELDREDPTAAPEQHMVNEDLTQALDHLTERERTYLQYRFGTDGETEHSREETAQHFRLSTNRAKRIEEDALKKLRGMLA